MRRSSLLPAAAALCTLAVTATGCGLLGNPVHSTSQEVLDAVLALRDGAEVRVTAELTLDEDELREALRDDPEALELFREAFDSDEVEDVDTLLAELEEAQAMLADHALLLATGADGSVRVAAEYRDSPWADLRVGTDLDPEDDPAEGFRFDLQFQVDWATAAAIFEQPDLLGDLDEFAEQAAPFLGESPELGAIEQVVVGFLAGELVGIGGEFGPELFERLGLTGEDVAGATSPESVFGFPGADLDPRELAETAFTFDDYRRDGNDTLVDVTLELHAAGELLLDELADADGPAGMDAQQLDEARAELAELPQQLTDVATLRFDASGALRQVRVDLLDVSLQVARATEPEDTDVATAERLAAELDATGLFLLLEVEGVGATGTVLGDPVATVTPEELAAAVGLLFMGGMGGMGRLGGFEEGRSFEEEFRVEEDLGAFELGLTPDQLAVGDCFNTDVLFGFAEPDAPPTVPCDEPHIHEVIAVVTVQATNRDELDVLSFDACFTEFEAYVGVPYAESQLFLEVLHPTSEQFEEGLRQSACYVSDGSDMTGSVAGTGR